MDKMFIVKTRAELFRAYREAKQRESAAKRDAEHAMKEMGLPDATELVAMLGVKKGEKAQAVIQDGNGIPLGKISVFLYPETLIPEGWRSRIS